tara:strand:- start:46865 stop:47068 length:204 start_codon:yes stop_codon:yes gene_type:complete
LGHERSQPFFAMHTAGDAIAAFLQQVLQATPPALGGCRGLLTEHGRNPVDEMVCVVLKPFKPALRWK